MQANDRLTRLQVEQMLAHGVPDAAITWARQNYDSARAEASLARSKRARWWALAFVLPILIAPFAVRIIEAVVAPSTLLFELAMPRDIFFILLGLATIWPSMRFLRFRAAARSEMFDQTHLAIRLFAGPRHHNLPGLQRLRVRPFWIGGSEPGEPAKDAIVWQSITAPISRLLFKLRPRTAQGGYQFFAGIVRDRTRSWLMIMLTCLAVTLLAGSVAAMRSARVTPEALVIRQAELDGITERVFPLSELRYVQIGCRYRRNDNDPEYRPEFRLRASRDHDPNIAGWIAPDLKYGLALRRLHIALLESDVERLAGRLDPLCVNLYSNQDVWEEIFLSVRP